MSLPTDRCGAVNSERGFTLLETLVALAIFSLAALALLRVQAITLRTAGDLDERQMAQIVAANLMTERVTDPTPPPLGDATGEAENGGRRWRWRQSARPLAEGDALAVRVMVEGDSSARAVLDFAWVPR